jgi:glutamate mutase epsilon subunit
MKKSLIAIAAFLSITFSANAETINDETKVVTETLKESIEVYTTFVLILKLEYYKFQNNLMDNDPNFYKISNIIESIINESKSNMNPTLIEPFVYSAGSGRFINEYKALFICIFNKEFATKSIAKEVTYMIDKNGRIAYLEAKGIFKPDNIQVFDRSLLKRFSVTRSKFKNPFKRDLR